MITRVRNGILVFGAASFVMMATGVALFLHLARYEHPDHHDAAHCRICQQLLISPQKYTSPPPEPVAEERTVQLLVENCPTIYTGHCDVKSGSPRAPPHTC